MLTVLSSPRNKDRTLVGGQGSPVSGRSSALPAVMTSPASPRSLRRRQSFSSLVLDYDKPSHFWPDIATVLQSPQTAF
jgi:hypothetical protein